MNGKADEVRIALRVTNNLTQSRTLIVEPWLSEYALPTGKSLDLLLTGHPKHRLEVDVDDAHITVYGFDSEGATMSVRDGENEAEHLRFPR